MGTSRRCLLVLIGLILGFWGCSQTSKGTLQRNVQVPSRDADFMTYLEKARIHEECGDLVSALEAYNIALALSPSDQEALENRNHLKTAMNRRAEDHYREGRDLYDKGRYGKARMEFLEALRLRPEYPEVIEVLTAGEKIQAKREVLHIVHTGESLSEIAQRYYDDPRKFHVIAQYNEIRDVTRIQAGREIKIPEIEGIPFHPEGGSRGSKGDYGQKSGEVDEGAQGPTETKGDLQEKGEGISTDKAASPGRLGVEFYVKGKYREAIDELTRVLSEHPEDELSLEFCSKAHFQTALSLFEQEDYLTAKTHFKAAMENKKHCQQCSSYLKQCDARYMEFHYKTGMEHYGKEELLDAIREWELVHHIDPAYKRVNYLITLAKTMLKNLGKIRQDIKNH